MSREFSVAITGIEKAMAFFENRGKAVNIALKKEVKDTAFNVERRAKELVPNFRGDLSKKIEHRFEDDGLTAVVGVGALGDLSPQMEIYAEVMEAGRTPGARPPPSDALVPWVKRYISTDNLEGMAYVVSRSIGEKGIAPHRYMGTAWLEYGEGFSDRCVKVIWEAINK